MQINISLELTPEQTRELLSWVFKEGTVTNILMEQVLRQIGDSLSDWNLSVITSSALRARNISTVLDLISLTKKDLLRIKGIGRKCCLELETVMGTKGLKFKND